MNKNNKYPGLSRRYFLSGLAALAATASQAYSLSKSDYSEDSLLLVRKEKEVYAYYKGIEYKLVHEKANSVTDGIDALIKRAYDKHFNHHLRQRTNVWNHVYDSKMIFAVLYHNKLAGKQSLEEAFKLCKC